MNPFSDKPETLPVSPYATASYSEIEIEKVLDKDNLPEWARISVSSSLAVKARANKK